MTTTVSNGDTFEQLSDAVNSFLGTIDDADDMGPAETVLRKEALKLRDAWNKFVLGMVSHPSQEGRPHAAMSAPPALRRAVATLRVLPGGRER